MLKFYMSKILEGLEYAFLSRKGFVALSQNVGRVYAHAFYQLIWFDDPL